MGARVRVRVRVRVGVRVRVRVRVARIVTVAHVALLATFEELLD